MAEQPGRTHQYRLRVDDEPRAQQFSDLVSRRCLAVTQPQRSRRSFHFRKRTQLRKEWGEDIVHVLASVIQAEAGVWDAGRSWTESIACQ